MTLSYRHEVVAPNLHKYVFASQSRPGFTHEVLVDLDAPPEDRLSCLCEASLYGKLCKHKRLIIRGDAAQRGDPRDAGARWLKRRARARRRAPRELG